MIARVARTAGLIAVFILALFLAYVAGKYHGFQRGLRSAGFDGSYCEKAGGE